MNHRPLFNVNSEHQKGNNSDRFVGINIFNQTTSNNVKWEKLIRRYKNICFVYFICILTSIEVRVCTKKATLIVMQPQFIYKASSTVNSSDEV